MLSSPLSSLSSLVTGRCPLQSARVCQLKQKSTCLTGSWAFLQFPHMFPCISLCLCALLPCPCCPDGSRKRGWICTCLLPIMQRMDKDLPNGSGKRGIFSMLVCVCTLPVGWAQEGDRRHHHTHITELWSSVTLKIPLVPVQGWLLFPVAATESVAGPGLPHQPHPHCPPVKTMRLFLPSSAAEAGIKLSLVELLESAWGWLGWCCLRAPSPTSCSGTRSHGHSLGSCCHWISLLEVETWLSLAGAQLLLLLPQPGSWAVLPGVSSSAVQQPGNALQLLTSSCWRCPERVLCSRRWCELCTVSLLPGGMVLIRPVLKK